MEEENPNPNPDEQEQDTTIVVGPSWNGGLVQLLEGDKSGREWEVLLIEKGLSQNKFNYTEKVLREAVPLFEGVYSFADHTNEEEQRTRPERSVKDKVGRFTNVKYKSVTVDGRITEGITARFKVIAPWLRDLLKESVEMGEPDFVGFSIDALGRSTVKQEGGKRIKEVAALKKVYSVDVVTNPSAGGRLMRLVASHAERRTGVDPEEENGGGSGGAAVATPKIQLTQEQLAQIVREQVAAVIQEANRPTAEQLQQQSEELTRIREANRIRSNQERYEAALRAAEGLSDAGRERLRASFSDAATRRDLEDDEILTAIRESASYEAALVQPYLTGTGGTSRTRVMSASQDKMYLALLGMFHNEDQKDADGKSVPRFRTIKEAYCRWEGRDAFDVDPMEIQRAFGTRYDSAVDHNRIQESLTTASWGDVYADVIYNLLIAAYRASPMYNVWRQFVSDIENVPDFQTRHWARLGGYGNLDIVPEAGTYQPLTSFTDEGGSYSVAKRGGLDDITFESIANDRVGAVRRIPTGLARSAVRTLFSFVMEMITTSNPVMAYDSTTLYHTNHANTSTDALSLTGLQKALSSMRSQTAYGETLEILGERNRPKVLIVPTLLELVAQRIVSPSDAYLAAIAAPGTEQSLDPQAFKGMGISYVVYDQLTSSTGWYAVGDPNEIPTMVVGFLNGREDPELFVQDQPYVGSNFTADKVTYKVRHIYGATVIDHRSFYRGNT